MVLTIKTGGRRERYEEWMTEWSSRYSDDNTAVLVISIPYALWDVV